MMKNDEIARAKRIEAWLEGMLQRFERERSPFANASSPSQPEQAPRIQRALTSAVRG